MHKPVKYMINSCLALAFSLTTAVQAFTPSEYAPSDDLLYIEIAPFTATINKTREFMTGLLGKAAAAQHMKMLEQQTQMNTGLNLFNPATLKSMGFDVDSPIGLSADFNPESNNDDVRFLFYLPASDSTDLYYTIRKIMTSESTAKLNVVSKGSHFTVQNGSETLQVKKADSFVLLTNLKKSLNSYTEKNPRAVSKRSDYKKLKKSIESRAGGSPFFSLYINPDNVQKIAESISSITQGHLASMSEELHKEFARNLTGGAGYWDFNRRGTGFEFSYLYKTGYLQQTDSIPGRFLVRDAAPLRIDRLRKSPFFYMLLKFKINEIIAFLEKNDRQFATDIQNFENEFSREIKADFRNDLINNLTGNFSLNLQGLPREEKMESLESWPGYLSFGIKEGSGATFNRMMQTIKKKVDAAPEDAAAPAITYRKIGSTHRYKVVDKSNPANPVTFYVQIGGTEVIMTGSSNLLKSSALRTSSVPFVERSVRKKYNETTSFIYADIDRILIELQKGRMKAVLMPYRNYTRNLKNLYILSDIEGDTVNSEFRINLK